MCSVRVRSVHVTCESVEEFCRHSCGVYIGCGQS
jgi:hypothetical protein